MPSAFQNLSALFGDIHNHCSMGYGHGTLEEAYQNASLQLDFVCVTPHSAWPDMPSVDDHAELERVIQYSQEGFKKARGAWEEYLEATQRWHQPGAFVTFPGFEWHSLQYGDHHVVFKNADFARIFDEVKGISGMSRTILSVRESGSDAIAVPHHIGYRNGYRGINWQSLNPDISPLVEIYSMHGASESSQAPYPYLHTMGPRDGQGTLQYGLAQGHRVGVVASTDHHSAHPGSYGYGRVGVWAASKAREHIWEAFKARRTYALTGDNIKLQFSIDGGPIGSILTSGKKDRQIAIFVEGGGALDYAEIIYNNRVISREDVLRSVYKISDLAGHEKIKIHFEVGWGQKNDCVDWDVVLNVIGGDLLGVEPRFRGHDVVAPSMDQRDRYAFTKLNRPSTNTITFRTKTFGNPNTRTPATQGVCLEIRPTVDSYLDGTINGQQVTVSLKSLLNGSKTGFLGGFLSPAYCFHQLALQRSYERAFSLTHQFSDFDKETQKDDWYYVRVRQHNNQWAWSSPIWVAGGQALR